MNQDFVTGDIVDFNDGMGMVVSNLIITDIVCNFIQATNSWGTYIGSFDQFTKVQETKDEVLRIPKCECGNSKNPIGQGHSNWCNLFKQEF